MKLHRLLIIVSLGAQSALAQGLDDFSTAGKNTSKWGTNFFEGNGQLSASGDGVLRYSLTGAASGNDFMAWPFFGDGPFSQSWSVQADVNVPVIALSPGFTAIGMGIAVLNSHDANDAFSAALENLRSGPEPQSHHFLNSFDVNGSTTETYAPTSSTNAAVRIAWDASTQILSAAYDSDGATDGYSWTTFRTFNPVSAGNWNMTGTETFAIFLLGYSEGTDVTLAHNVFADNFYVLDSSHPSLNISRNGDQVQLSWSRLALGFGLQSSATINGGWSAVTNAISISGERNVVTLGPSASISFFRLGK